VIRDVAETFGEMAFVHGNFDRFSGSLFFRIKIAEKVIKLAGLHLFWDISYENAALFISCFQVRPKKRLVEWQTSTLFTLNLEIPQYRTSLLEFLVVLKSNESRVEGLGRVSMDLWCHVQVDFHRLQDLCQLIAPELDLR